MYVNEAEATYEVAEGEAFNEGNDVIQSADLFWSERDLKGLYVGMQVFDFTSADDREDVRGLLHDPSNGDYDGEF